MKKKLKQQIILLSLLLVSECSIAQITEVQYLSGRDKDHTVQWDFMCTAGHNSGKSR